MKNKTETKREIAIDTKNKDPVMMAGLLQPRLNEMYEVIVEGERVIVQRVPCIAL